MRLAPFHLLASEWTVHVDKDHLWHMTTLAELAREGSPIMATRHLAVDLNDAAAVDGATRWWEELTAAGGEGMTRTDISYLFGRNKSADHINQALGLLLSLGRARREIEETGGRKAERWFRK